ncbi:hypothetical protein CAPTEDRAFT_139759 [Capitella teleta]|uniref:Titin n=1 Tax=Capitella teleta TaxID=283909 RepID=R7TR13_CAPTE|nr:hypothetical protein CAPTEDRAFT_139759 [Capitella teleta]|eukprot:ELT96017.1 hypothetical protein CAPTEDRAFT_139759 [Capitella teleta]
MCFSQKCYNLLLFVDKPSVPLNLRVTEVFKDFVVLAWDAPESDGGAPINAYTVEKRDMKRAAFVKADTTDGQTLTLKVPKLVEGSEYMFKVNAENEVGTSEWASLTEPVKAHPPNPPINVMVNDVTKTSAMLTWEPPEFDGGSPVTGYVVERQGGYSSKWSKLTKTPITDLQLEITDLKEKEDYDLRVSALNAAGTSKPTATGKFTAKDPYDKPGKPGTPEQKLKAQSTLIISVNVSGEPEPKLIWFKEDEEIGKSETTTIETSKNVSTLTIKKISSSDSGIYKVTAQNEAGEDSADFTITIKGKVSIINQIYAHIDHTLDKPSPPRDVRVKEVNKDYVVVTWDVPESDGGCPITGYLVEKKDAAKKTYIKADSTDAATLELKVTKLVEGKEYDIRVFAENEIGSSDPAGLPKPVKARLPFGKL